MTLCALANSLWHAQCRRATARFERALRDPAAAQSELLTRSIADMRKTAYGHDHLETISTADDFRTRIPLQTYDDLEPWIDRIRRGEQRVLTADPVTHLIPTSGSTSAAKLIPFTRGLQTQFNAAIRPWIADLFDRHPDVRCGPAYWSISPAIPSDHDSAVPIGFDDDSAYLGRLARRLVSATLAVPNDVRHIHDVDDFRYTTLWWLLRARELRFVSIWHPSFWSLLLEKLPQWWDRLLKDVATGVCRAPSGSIRARGRRGPSLDACEPDDLRTLWPRLRVISAWSDAAAARPFAALQRDWPQAHLQPKGLISTEAFISLPYRDTHPLAITSHIIELLDDDGVCHPPHRADIGGTYEPIVTTAGGLCRYRTGDLIEITGRLHATPTIRFLGRRGAVSDLCGEKLHEVHVARAIEETLREAGIDATFAMLTPAGESAPTHYTLWIDASLERLGLASIAGDLDSRLRSNPHYNWARELGQLGPAVAQAARPQSATPLLASRAHDRCALGAAKLPSLGTVEEHNALRLMGTTPSTR